MNDKVKKKIQAMAEEYNKTQVGRTFRYGEEYPDFYKEGATPWAEWCERFAYELNDYLGYEKLPGGSRKAMENILKEYNQWLEEE